MEHYITLAKGDTHMDSTAKIKINGKTYMIFLSEDTKNVFIKNKVAAKDLAKKYVDSQFTVNGVCHYDKVGTSNICILTIRAHDAESNDELSCFVMNALGNYKELRPVSPNKWSVELACGHRAIIDDTVDKINSDHVVKCFKCKEKK
jgi:hypothetical protein